MKTLKIDKYNINSNFGFGSKSRKKLNQDLGDELIENHQLAYIKGNFYQYQNSKWEFVSDTTLIRLVHEKLKENKIEISRQKVTAVRDYMKIELHTPPKQEKGSIYFKNGFYDPKKNKDKFTHYSDESKANYVINYIKTDYQKEAECPKWLRFIGQLFENDPDQEAKIQLLQEYMGYCLTLDNRMQKALFLYGNGRNGKSVLLEVLEHILSPDNVSNVPFEKLNSEKYIIQLNNKYLNVISELNPKAKNSFDAFKRIVGGDKLTGRSLYKDPVKFENTAKLIFGVNHLPFTQDNSDGFYRRVLVLKFNNQFKGERVNIHLADELKQEKEGIIKWMIEGLERLNRQNGFTIPESSISILEEYKEENDNVLHFVKDYCKLEQGAVIPNSELYERYVNLCKEERTKPLSRLHFKREILNKFPEVEYKPVNLNGKTHRCLININ